MTHAEQRIIDAAIALIDDCIYTHPQPEWKETDTNREYKFRCEFYHKLNIAIEDWKDAT